ncbi:NADP-dependent oxidoreductase domain protein [Niveomyces insectorum RCEF 264]|uniref:NADP-dependent oxidoreductase domain protein n=1 Tax=Niveomyces insectorum RCEF 264 TaxID=1081102 RepID=A0A167ZCD6_9HYPO|nr:NADP-dependent oxidoreductase domain protein [Niveomyces insectorum RCEF 264]
MTVSGEVPVQVAFGSAGIGNRDPFISEADLNKLFATLDAHGVTRLDSAQIYGVSEKRLGEVHAGDRFTIDTKWGNPTGFAPGNTTPWATQAYVLQSAQESIARLNVKQVDVFYLHFPDANTPLAETLAGVDAAYRLGLFRRFGLSNYDAAGVQAIYDHAKAHGYVLPTVYQGNYNPVTRKGETDLFPTLRRLGIAFFAYSPLAGGLLTKTAQQFHDGAGRFQKGSIFHNLYNKPAYVDSLAQWEAAAQAAGVSRAELAYRWVAWNSILRGEHGDSLIVGASTQEQLAETLGWIAHGPLDDAAVARIDKVWAGVAAATKDEAK